MPRKSYTKKIDKEEFIRLWTTTDMRVKDMAERFGCLPPAVTRMVKVLGLTPRETKTQKRLRRQAKLEERKSIHMVMPTRISKMAMTYADVEEMVAKGMTRTQAMQQFHRMRG